MRARSYGDNRCQGRKGEETKGVTSGEEGEGKGKSEQMVPEEGREGKIMAVWKPVQTTA